MGIRHVALAVIVCGGLLAGPVLATTDYTNGWIYGAVVGAPCWGEQAPGGLSTITSGGTSEGNVCTGIYKVLINTTAPYDYSGTQANAVISYLASHPALNGRLNTFCCDVHQNADSGYTKYAFYAPANAPIGGDNTAMGATKALDLRRLVELHWTAATSGDNQAAWEFQASVWEIVNETSSSYDLTQGYFKVSGNSTWVTEANGWLNGLSSDLTPTVPVWVLASESAQDYAIWFPGLGGSMIPEPLTMAGLMMGIGGLAGYVRRRRAA